MAFKPLTLDGRAAAQRLLEKKTHPKHQCLNAVFWAFPFRKSDAPGAYSSARVQWARTPAARRRVGDRGVPAGGIVHFDLAVSGTRDPRPGHICISLGGDRVVTTDWPERGKIGIATIGEIERKWGAKYLGWTDVVGGHNVSVGVDPDSVVVGQPAGAGKPVKLVKRQQVVVAKKGLWFRQKPSIIGKRISILADRSVVTTTGRVSGKWEEAQVGGKIGWLHSDFIIWRSRTVTAKNGLNLRLGATERSQVRGVLANGTKVTIVAAAGVWRQVKAAGRTGWVHSGYLK